MICPAIGPYTPGSSRSAATRISRSATIAWQKPSESARNASIGDGKLWGATLGRSFVRTYAALVVAACAQIRRLLRSLSLAGGATPGASSTPLLTTRYGAEKSTDFARPGVIVTCDTATSNGFDPGVNTRAKGTSTIRSLTPSLPASA